jgi:hypothetical protein
MRLSVNRTRAFGRVSFAVLALLALSTTPPSRADDAAAPLPAARQSPAWLRNSVVYEVFPRAFSPEGTPIASKISV